MAQTKKKTRREYLQEYAEAYRAAGNPWPATSRQMAQWMIDNGHVQYAQHSIVQSLAREIQGALRDEYMTDPQGRRVRRKHSFRIQSGGEQLSLWCDIHDGLPEEMLPALQGRRAAIVGDCRQLKLDSDSYNDNNPHGAYINLSFNFEPDIIELELDTEYNPGPPPEDD